MMSYPNIFFSVTLYISGIAIMISILVFYVLPTKRIVASEFDLKIAERVATRSAYISYGDGQSWKYLREKTLELQGDRCLCCGRKAPVMHIDHIKPKSRYPHLEYMIDNLQVLCPTCNRKKSSTSETDYRRAEHLITLLREVNGNKLIKRKYIYDMEVLKSLATKRFNAELKNKDYPQVLPLS